MILTRTVPPDTEPITLAEAKTHLRVDGNQDDAYITALITVAREHVETELRRTLAPSTWEFITDAAPVLTLPMPPIITIESVTDENDDDIDYTLQLDKSLKLNATGLVKVVYTAGVEEVPAAYKHAMLLIIGHLFENREEVVIGSGLTASQLPMGVSNLLAPTRHVRF